MKWLTDATSILHSCRTLPTCLTNHRNIRAMTSCIRTIGFASVNQIHGAGAGFGVSSVFLLYFRISKGRTVLANRRDCLQMQAGSWLNGRCHKRTARTLTVFPQCRHVSTRDRLCICKHYMAMRKLSASTATSHHTHRTRQTHRLRECVRSRFQPAWQPKQWYDVTNGVCICGQHAPRSMKFGRV